jgi:hypothetical protein
VQPFVPTIGSGGVRTLNSSTDVTRMAGTICHLQLAEYVPSNSSLVSRGRREIF